MTPHILFKIQATINKFERNLHRIFTTTNIY